MNKSAQIGSTLSWFFGVIVIFLILLIFLIFSAGIAVQKVSIKDLILGGNSEETVSTSYESFRTAVFFLESDYDGQRMVKKISDPKFFLSGKNYRTEILDVFNDQACLNIYFVVFNHFWCQKSGEEVHCGEKDFTSEDNSLDYTYLDTSHKVKFVNLSMPLDTTAEGGWEYLPIKFAARNGCDE